MQDQDALQATQQIIHLFENSKRHAEAALESLPGIYAVIQPNGQILKGNLVLAALLGVNLEDQLGVSLEKLFTPESWKTFSQNLEKLRATSDVVDFQTDIIGKDSAPMNFLWNATIFGPDRPDSPRLITIIGRDVTELTRTTALSSRMQVELKTAQDVQEMLLPEETATFGTSTIAGFYQAASECGGDWWHYCMMKDRLFLWIGDVTGHGVSAALITSAVYSAVSTISGQSSTPANAMAHLNHVICSTAKGRKSMTFLIASIDLETGLGVYCSAAHEPALIHTKAAGGMGREWKSLAAKPTAPLGCVPNYIYPEYPFKLAKGDQLFLYTDGLRDVANPKNETFKSTGIRETLKRVSARAISTREFALGFRHDLSDFRKNTPLDDDVTFMIFQY